MKTIKYGFLLLFLLLTSCGGDSNSYSIEMQEGDVPVVVGSTNNLMWQMEDSEDYNTLFHKMDYGQSSTFCANLEYAGFSDWRMATIDELRTIVSGYSSVASDGKCKVSESCSTLSCHQSGGEDSCHNNDSNPPEGPGAGGCFWSDSWSEKYCDEYWSITDVRSGDDSMTWMIDYKAPAIISRVKASGSATAYVRCVREIN
ncbi:DUF1566 domain-containing protein [bacterium]|nr:DUF1566 domain-containing protein [bacterium]